MTDAVIVLYFRRLGRPSQLLQEIRTVLQWCFTAGAVEDEWAMGQSSMR